MRQNVLSISISPFYLKSSARRIIDLPPVGAILTKGQLNFAFLDPENRSAFQRPEPLLAIVAISGGFHIFSICFVSKTRLLRTCISAFFTFCSTDSDSKNCLESTPAMELLLGLIWHRLGQRGPKQKPCHELPGMFQPLALQCIKQMRGLFAAPKHISST